MRTDAQWTFVGTSAPLSLVGAAGVDIPTNPIDLLGQGAGTKPANIFGTQSALFGTDFGQNSGLLIPKLVTITGTAFTTASACTLIIQFQAAPDTAVTYQPGTWQTLMETGAITAAQLTAATKLPQMDWPPRFPDNLRPRFVRVNFHVLAAADFTAGTIAFCGVVPDQDALASRQAQRNYSVS